MNSATKMVGVRAAHKQRMFGKVRKKYMITAPIFNPSTYYACTRHYWNITHITSPNPQNNQE